jgi:3-hydroxy-9,10-secoandrosta-1,3,5(10)-triene-9,17-dione monooxygenase
MSNLARAHFAPPTIDRADILARAEALRPALAARARETAERRSLSDDMVAELHAAGLMRLLQPRRYGGFASDWKLHVEVGRILARACPSSAWIQCVVGIHTWLASRFSAALQDEIFAQPKVLIGTAVAGGRAATVVPVEGGWRLSGRWRFVSGVDHAHWVILGAMPEDPQKQAEHNFLQLAIERRDIEIVDTWFTEGLRGTGSKDVIVRDLFVPTYRTLWRRTMRGHATPDALRHDGYVHHVQFAPYFGSITLGPLIGATEGLIEAYLDVTRKRTGQILGDEIAAQTPVQLRIAQSCAEVRAAALLVERILDELHEAGAAGRAVTQDEWLKHRADGAMAAKLCLDAGERLVRMMGASGLTSDNPVRSFWNDVQAAAAHISVQPDLNFAPFGRWALGLPSGQSEIDAAPAGGTDLF